MARVDVIVMHNHLGVHTARLANGASQPFTLQEIEIERNGQNENFSCVSFESFCQAIDRRKFYDWRKSQDGFASRRNFLRLGAGLIPCRVPAVEIGGEDEGLGQCSFPPMRPCLVMEASTSTIARTATSAVISEIS